MKKLICLTFLVLVGCAPSDAKWEKHEFSGLYYGQAYSGPREKEPSYTKHFVEDLNGEEFYLTKTADDEMHGDGVFNCLISPKRKGDTLRKIWRVRKISNFEE